MPIFKGEVPKALDNNLGILDNFHPITANGWIEVPRYIERLKMTRQACIETELAFNNHFGEGYVGARAALVIARQTTEEEINLAMAAVTHMQSGGCAGQGCQEECYKGLNSQKLRFHCALELCARYFAEESPEL